MKEYDENLARRTYDKLEGTDNERAAALAEIHGVGEEIKSYLGKGPYRGHGDLVSLVGKLVKEKEQKMLVLREQSLETIVEPQENVSKPKVVYELTKDISKGMVNGTKMIARYVVYGALPSRYQEKLAKINNENAMNYTTAEYLVESLIYPGMCVYGTVNDNPVILFSGLICSGLNLIRFLIERETKKPTGSPLLSIPYHAIRAPYVVAKFLGEELNKLYSKKKEELEGKVLESETEELPQLPSPENSTYQVSIDNNELKVLDPNGNDMIEKALAEGKKQ